MATKAKRNYVQPILLFITQMVMVLVGWFSALRTAQLVDSWQLSTCDGVSNRIMRLLGKWVLRVPLLSHFPVSSGEFACIAFSVFSVPLIVALLAMRSMPTGAATIFFEHRQWLDLLAFVAFLPFFHRGDFFLWQKNTRPKTLVAEVAKPRSSALNGQEYSLFDYGFYCNLLRDLARGIVARMSEIRHFTRLNMLDGVCR